MLRSAVGIDLGGTNVRVALVESDGAVRDNLVEVVDWSPTQDGQFGQLTRAVTQLLGRWPHVSITGIGVAATGPADTLTGVIDNPFTLPPTMRGNVVDVLERAFGQPVVLENDADAAALGEATFGAAVGASSVACITVGTGVGVGVVTGGEIYRGPRGSHPEVGHHVVDPAGPLCYCGAYGCLESLASASAILAAGVTQGVVTTVASAHDVHLLAEAGNRQAQDIVATAAAALATGIWNVVAFHSSDVVVLAGQAAPASESFLLDVNRRLAAFPFRPPGGVRVVPARLAGLSGCVGAASLLLRA